MKEQKRAISSKKPLQLFLVPVTIFAAIGYMDAFKMGDDNRTGGVFIVQFSPLGAAFITKLMFQRNLRGLGWGWGKTRCHTAAYGLAFLIPLISFGLVWVLGFGGFYDVTYITEAQTGIAEMFGIIINSPWIVMLVLIAVNGTVGMFVAFGGIGEELGWRGLLSPRALQAL